MSSTLGVTEIQPLSFNEDEDSDVFFDDDCDGPRQDDTEYLDNLLGGGEHRAPVQICTERNFRILAVILMIIIVMYPAMAIHPSRDSLSSSSTQTYNDIGVATGQSDNYDGDDNSTSGSTTSVDESNLP
eukprot:CAMPEP_0198266288 /NCGR_PEP_ID=MMETSP1447-20131203/27516_1 /TAXON_ID=420782 /ORGANISM="Chaetoceros dichaeta, Strain CCMP1751" /LENGTH=128 /DNA_ID=CAMNT_0043956275 /DNA_START=27 /DNA_END=413 /DNA_ORIENTATION=-